MNGVSCCFKYNSPRGCDRNRVDAVTCEDATTRVRYVHYCDYYNQTTKNHCLLPHSRSGTQHWATMANNTDQLNSDLSARGGPCTRWRAGPCDSFCSQFYPGFASRSPPARISIVAVTPVSSFCLTFIVMYTLLIIWWIDSSLLFTRYFFNHIISSVANIVSNSIFTSLSFNKNTNFQMPLFLSNSCLIWRHNGLVTLLQPCIIVLVTLVFRRKTFIIGHIGVCLLALYGEEFLMRAEYPIRYKYRTVAGSPENGFAKIGLQGKLINFSFQSLNRFRFLKSNRSFCY